MEVHYGTSPAHSSFSGAHGAAYCSESNRSAHARLDGPFSRPILPSRRYLPPPARAGMNDLEHRMRREVVLTYVLR
jgi:hypothetical protein